MIGTLIAVFIIGCGIGIAIGFYLRARTSKSAETLAAELAQHIYEANEQQRQAQVEMVVDSLKQNFSMVVENVKQSFGGLSLDALNKMSDQFLAVAGERLGAERDAGAREIGSARSLIDQRLASLQEGMTAKLAEVTSLVKSLEGDRRQSMGEVSQRLEHAGEQIVQLTGITRSLREALSSTKTRGQWGERMAEDVLRAAGLIDGVNYIKQVTLVEGTRPDFTFILPKERTLNMDVKFPFENYLRYLEAETEIDQARYKKAFLADVRLRMKEVATRAYIDPDQGTCDYALLFIPNESIYQFIHAEDSELLDVALRNRVVFCSPITLFAVLAVIRTAVDQFAMEKTANEILAVIAGFRKQWGLFVEQMDKVGKRIEDAQKEFQTLSGVRQRQLERPMAKIEELRTGQEVIADEPIDSTALEAAV
jgi:DNA recombination protein RmuC